MTEKEILDGAGKRVQEHRTAEARLHFVDAGGRPLPAFSGRVTLLCHEFKLGANAFRLLGIEDQGLQRAYQERFAALLNYATLPFYWGGYEPERSKTSEERLEKMAEWCRANHVTAKGHPLAWHEVFPKWAESLPDPDVLSLLEERVRRIVSHFKGGIDIWDVVNEATVSHRFENAVGRWIGKNGAGECVGEALTWAHEANPEAVLLYNDFNVSVDFEQLVQSLLDRKAPLHTIGIQSHMHKGTWSIDKAWDVCETYARFGLPLHFTELTILSGRLKAQDDNDWHRRHDDWPSTPEGEARQLEYGGKLYATLFSHPAVEAVTCWDFSDNGAWQGAPAGLVRSDMSPKPLYEHLIEMFSTQWHTDEKVSADAKGAALVRCFFGEYEVEGAADSGETLKGVFKFERRGGRDVQVQMA